MNRSSIPRDHENDHSSQAAATVLAGEISLASAILAGDWVTGHEQLGRNR